jgi:hypothetical protein
MTTPLLQMGKAGLGLVSFLFMMSLGVLFLGRPPVGSSPFIMTVLVLAVSVTVGAVLMLAMRRMVRTHDIAVDQYEGEHHE